MHDTKRYIHNFYIKNKKRKLKNNGNYNNNVINNLLSLIDNRLFLIFDLLLEYEYNSNGYKNKEKFLKKTFTKSGISEIYDKYECLKNIIENEIDHSFNFINTFLSRLETDIRFMSQRIINKENTSLNTINKLTLELSDRHEDSSTVIIIHFKNGSKILYKPRSLKIDIFYGKIINSINEILGKKVIHAPLSLDMGNYGWQEFIAEKTCLNKAGIKKYYENQGINIALIYLLGGGDYHNENIIANSIYPTLIDIETIIQPGRMANKKNDEFDIFMDNIIDGMHKNVYRTGMLHSLNNKGIDLSALYYDLQKIKFESQSCAPILNKKRVNAIGYNKEVIKGFKENFNIIKSVIIEFLNEVKTDNKTEIRYIHRATQNYGNIIRGSLHPDNLRSINDRIKYIRGNLLIDQYNSTIDKIIKYETISLWNLNIPKFTTTLNSKDIKIGDFTIFNALDSSGYEKIIETIGTKNIIEDNISIIKNNYKIAKANYAINTQKNIINNNKYIIPENLKKESEKEAFLIYNYLMENVRSNEYFATLISSMQKGNKIENGQLNGELYDGLSGICIFLGAYSRIYGNNEGINITKKIFKTATILEKENDNTGVFGGKIGIGYAGTILYKITNDNFYLEESKKIIKESINENNNEIDIISGIAGELIIYIKMYKDLGLKFLETSIEFKKNKLISYVNNYFKKENIQNNTITKSGFAHGISGIIKALNIYNNSISNDKRVNTLIKKLVLEENKYFQETDKNWKINNNKTYTNQTAWCYGSPGIILARLGLNDKKCESINYSSFADINDSDCLCHGNMGNIDILIEYNKNKNNKYSEVIDKNIINILSAKKYKKNEWITGLPGNIESKGLMTGCAGIGYGLLRYLHKEKLPSILNLDI